MADMPPLYPGPEDGLEKKLLELAKGVWVTSGRAVVIEGGDGLCLIDPGDEPMLDGDNAPIGPLTDLLVLIEQTGKPLHTVLLTHAHPDHTANLYVLRQQASKYRQLGAFKLLAHAKSPMAPNITIDGDTQLDFGLMALSTPGHTHWGDDLSFWHPESAILFSGDLVQPKGEEWSSTFYPSPYPYFTDGALYIDSLDKLLALPFETLVTGHREIRSAPKGRQWVELTRKAIRRVDEEVGKHGDATALEEAGAQIYRTLARERGIDEITIEKRMTGGGVGASAFASFDMPGIRYFWERRFGKGGPE